MGLVCTIALMGSPTEAKEGEGNEGAKLALLRLKQVMVAEQKFQVNEETVPTDGRTTFPAYTAYAGDLEKVSVECAPLVSVTQILSFS